MIAEAAAPFLGPWTNFYVIVGSSAGALTGLQFVVIALVADAQGLGSGTEIRAFGSPTVVHFSVALLISAIANAPWKWLSSAAIAFGLCGAAGVIYALTVIRHARAQTHYSPDAEDWFWYAALPLVTYATLLGAGKALPWHPDRALFVVAGTSLLLLFIGIHNAWDTVTYVALAHMRKSQRSRDSGEGDD
jgi:hypothetical protein